MRLFVAVDIDEATRRRIEHATVRLRRVMERPRSPVRIAWVLPDRLHLTHQFVGRSPRRRWWRDRGCLEAPFDQSPFELRFGPLGTFPPTGPPRVVWLGLEQGARELASLQAAVARRLEHRVPPRVAAVCAAPHAGTNQGGGTRADRERIAGARLEPAGGCTIDHVTLYGAVCRHAGQRCMPLASTPLVGPPLSSPERVR